MYDIPFKHGYSTNFVDDEFANKINTEFPKWNDSIWKTNGKVFNSEYGLKKELTDRLVMPSSITKFLSIVESQKFIDRISSTINLTDLYIDKNLYGGGLNIYPPDSFLDPHVDYNYDNDIKAYRVVNLIYYVNSDWIPKYGGCLELYNIDRDRKKIIPPKLNTCIIFAQNNKTIHGIAQINKFYRKSISIWYYSKTPSPYLSATPHQTVWLK